MASAAPRTRRRRAPKGAAASILVLQAAIVLMMLTVLGYVTGQMSAAKETLNTRADAIVLTTTEAVKRHGPQGYCNDPALQALLMDYHADCPPLERVGNSFLVHINDQSMNVDIPTGFFDHQQVAVSSNVVGQVRHEYATVEERRPKFVLVLDYSGSMASSLPGGGAAKIDVLRQSINAMLDRHYRVDYGAVLFSQDVMAQVPIARNNEAAVRAQLARNDLGPATNYDAPLNAARGLFMNQPNQGYYVLFATDGEPNAGAADHGLHQADLLWNMDVTIFTLNIGALPGARGTLRGLSGSPQLRHDPHFALEAANAAQFRHTFDQIVGFIVCRANLPAPEHMANANTVYVSVEDGGIETPAPLIPVAQFQNPPNLNDFDHHPYAALLPNEGEHGQVVLNQTACEPVLDNRGGRIVLRYERPGLASQ